MSTAVKHIEYRRYRAPREDGAALVEPPFEDAPALVAANLRCRARYRYDFHGLSLDRLARQAREELVASAVRWTSSYRDVNASALNPAGKLFLAGHQPQLFHPGVWFKNFALDGLAQQQDALAINLLVDSDTLKASTLRVPGGSVEHPRLALIPFDAPGPVIPFEEREVLDRSTFLAFGDRVAEHIAPLVRDPLIREYWPMAIARLNQGRNLGACLAQSRHQLEGEWGLKSLEVPQSWVCQLPAFAWFTIHLLEELPRLRAVYNEAVDEYRRLHHIRSKAHPVPDLAVDGEWMEAPYWVWTREDPRRRRLFVRWGPREITLSDRKQLEVALPLAEGDVHRAVERLLELPKKGIRLRSRALITTLWARLVLGDLFLHGIGGAKYDQVTDALIQRFFGVKPPGFMVLSATLLLPIARQRPRAEDARWIARRLRDLTWHPENAIDGAVAHGPEVADLIAAKKRWVQTPQTPDNARTRWRDIRRINDALQPWVAEEARRLAHRQTELANSLRADVALAWREYSFCLYPGRSLKDFFGRHLPNSP